MVDLVEGDAILLVIPRPHLTDQERPGDLPLPRHPRPAHVAEPAMGLREAEGGGVGRREVGDGGAEEGVGAGVIVGLSGERCRRGDDEEEREREREKVAHGREMMSVTG
jgi:hypothetical protein